MLRHALTGPDSGSMENPRRAHAAGRPRGTSSHFSRQTAWRRIHLRRRRPLAMGFRGRCLATAHAKRQARVVVCARDEWRGHTPTSSASHPFAGRHLCSAQGNVFLLLRGAVPRSPVGRGRGHAQGPERLSRGALGPLCGVRVRPKAPKHITPADRAPLPDYYILPYHARHGGEHPVLSFAQRPRLPCPRVLSAVSSSLVPVSCLASPVFLPGVLSIAPACVSLAAAVSRSFAPPSPQPCIAWRPPTARHGLGLIFSRRPAGALGMTGLQVSCL